jgi:S1-C subfamily serine protease
MACRRRFFPPPWPAVVLGAVLGCLAGCGGAPPGSVSSLATVGPATGIADIGTELSSTGFFVDNSGYMLTAGHSADGCAELYVDKEGQVLKADLVARSDEHDLALIKVRQTLGLPAVFARSARAAAHEMVFAAGYEVLPRVLAGGGALFNAVVDGPGTRRGSNSGGEDDDIELMSDATYGSSGAPVLSLLGLVIGVVTHKGAEGRVLATNGDVAKGFLAANHVVFDEDDRPQSSPLQDRAHRAQTISARVLCFKRSP